MIDEIFLYEKSNSRVFKYNYMYMYTTLSLALLLYMMKLSSLVPRPFARAGKAWVRG